MITDVKHFGVGLVGSLYFKENEIVGCLDKIDDHIFIFSARVNVDGSIVIKYMNNELVLDVQETFKEINPALLFSLLVYAKEDMHILYWLHKLPLFDKEKCRSINMQKMLEYIDIELYKHLTLLEITTELPKFKEK